MWLAITNLDPNQPAELEVTLGNLALKSAVGQTLTAAKVDSVNTFDAPGTVVPRPISVEAQGATLTLRLEPKSVSVVSVEP